MPGLRELPSLLRLRRRLAVPEMRMTFPMTEAEVHTHRLEHGFTTPVTPLREGDSYCVFASRGSYEFLTHPADAAHHLKHGVTINGEHHTVTLIDAYPHMGAYHLQANTPDVDAVFVDAAKATR